MRFGVRGLPLVKVLLLEKMFSGVANAALRRRIATILAEASNKLKWVFHNQSLAIMAVQGKLKCGSS